MNKSEVKENPSIVVSKSYRNTEIYRVTGHGKVDGVAYTEYTDTDNVRQREELEIGGSSGPYWGNCVVFRHRNHKPNSNFALPIGDTIRDTYSEELIEAIGNTLEAANKRAKKLWDYALSHSWEK